MFGRHFAFVLAGKTLLEAKQMSMIRLEHKNFAAAERLESVLRERLLNVVPADADAGGDQRSTTYVCSAVYEAALGGEEAAIARSRAQNRRNDDYRRSGELFQLTEALGGKLMRLSLPAGDSDAVTMIMVCSRNAFIGRCHRGVG